MARLRWKHLISAKGRAILKADRARDRGDAATAAALYGAIIARWGATFGLLMQFGNALKDSHDFDEAERVYLEAQDIKPQDADTFIQRGHLMKAAGKPRLAERHYAKAAELDPAHSSASEELLAIRAVLKTHHSEPDHLELRADMPFSASIVLHRIETQYRWRRG